MAPKIIAACCCILTLVGVTLGCAEQGTARSVESPKAPEMPAGWTVTKDVLFPASEVARVGKKLGGELRSLRNTDYEVKGTKVRLNTIETADAANAERIMASLLKLKPEDFLLRDGLIIYEFVGKNEAIPAMQAGRRHLQHR